MHFLHFGKHADTGGQGILLHLQLHMAIFGLLRLLPACIQTQSIAVDDIFDRVALLFRPGTLFPRFILLLLFLLHARVHFAQFLPDSLVPVKDFLSCCCEGRQQRLGLGGIGLLGGHALTQLLQLLQKEKKQSQQSQILILKALSP